MITSLAWEMKKWPSEVYDQFLENPKDIILMAGYSSFLNQEQKKEIDKSRSEMDSAKRRNG